MSMGHIDPPPGYTVGKLDGEWCWVAPSVPSAKGVEETRQEAVDACWEDHARVRDRERVIFLSIVRGACLSDHMGDMWNVLNEVAKLLDIELPEDDDDDIGDVSLEGVEAIGGRGIWTEPTLADYLKEHP